jgi:Stage II sporulation protein E (SpoIIE)/Lipocalin-like domain
MALPTCLPLLAVLLAAPAPPEGRTVEPVPDLDLERYAGRWYEVARLPNRFQTIARTARASGTVSRSRRSGTQRTGSPHFIGVQSDVTARRVAEDDLRRAQRALEEANRRMVRDLEEREVSLEPGDRLYVYSDGLIEASCGGDDHFGGERLTAVLASTRALSLKASVAEARRSVERWCGGAEPEDDVSLLAIEVGSGAARRS